jgi:hypothetical protein
MKIKKGTVKLIKNPVWKKGRLHIWNGYWWEMCFPSYAQVSWTIQDLQDLMPQTHKWDDLKCHKFLEKHKEKIEAVMIEAGIGAIKWLLPSEKITRKDYNVFNAYHLKNKE